MAIAFSEGSRYPPVPSCRRSGGGGGGGRGQDLLDLLVRTGDHVHRDELADPAGGGGSGVGGRLDGPTSPRTCT